ncbi:MAG: pilus assembly protein PilP [Thermodesulfovibrionales bacterium]
MMNKLAYGLILLAFIGLGCKDKVATDKKPVTQKQAATSPATSAAVQKEEPKVEKEIYVYDAKDRRDPFMSLVQAAKPKAQRKKGASPIEIFDVDEIKLIAIAWDSKQYYALITMPDSKSFTIRKGMTLGLNNGKVMDITKDSVLIQEQIKDYRGQTKSKDTILKLRKEEE